MESQIDNCSINPGKGINQISVYTTSLDSIYSVLGKTKLNEEHYKKSEGGNQYVLYYSEKGISVRMKKSKKGYEIIDIMVQKPYDCKTPNGIGIGTTKDELMEKMGKPNELFENETESHLDYKGILFLLAKDKNNKFVIDKIQVIKE